MKDIVTVAIDELGYTETIGEGGRSDYTKYGAWYGMNGAPWCHMFASWCAEQAGVKTNVVPKTASCAEGKRIFESWHRFRTKESGYRPKRNDFVYFLSGGWSHVGIVEKFEDGMLHTIEGNTYVHGRSYDGVSRKIYSYNSIYITGYGLVADYVYFKNDPFDSGTAKKEPGNSSGQTLTEVYDDTEYRALKSILERYQKTPEPDTINLEVDRMKYQTAASVDIFVKIGKEHYMVPVLDGARVTWERKGVAGMLSFQTMFDKKHIIKEGAPVLMLVNGKKFFYGFVFTQKMSKDRKVKLTVYDQLRYLKNEDTYIYEDKSSDALIRMIAKDYGLKVGTLEATGYNLSRIDDDCELFDIIQNSLDDTLMAKGKTYTLYDDAGRLMLRKPWQVLDSLIDEETGKDFTYTESIDKNVYNQIKLAYENGDTGTLDVYMAKSTKNQNRWGVLQYFEKIDDPKIAKLKANVLLKIYNGISRTIRIQGVIGNRKVRAGCLVPVTLDVGFVKINNLMLVNKVTHTFNEGSYTMDLDVSGGGFDVG